MRKSTFRKESIGFPPIAAGFMLMSSFLFAQTEEQVKIIRQESNVKVLNTLGKTLKNSPSQLRQLQQRVEKMGLEFSGETENGAFQFYGFDHHNGLPLYYITHNIDAARGTSTDKINSTGEILNLDGENMIIHEWDGGGTRLAHREFGGRVNQKDKPTRNSNHATHVAGTMIASGVDKDAKGMAPKAKLDAYDWVNDGAEMVEAAKNGALVSNHSYGLTSGFQRGSGNIWQWYGADEDTEYRYYGKYSPKDVEWDLIGLNAPYYLIVKAAGNDRGAGPEPGDTHLVKKWNATTQKWNWVQSKKVRQKNGGQFGFDTITQGALGKNILTVGAAEKIKGEYQNPADVKMASFSNFGPVDDGRIKPDIAGIGVNVYSAMATSNTAYALQSGTSMASPNVTGSLLLLQEHYSKLNGSNFMKAATLKALAIATANEAGKHDGPDYKSGWGLLNAHKAAVAISTRNQYSRIEEKTLANGNTDRISVTASGTEPLVITIAWTDPVPDDAGLPSYDMNVRTPVLINDLDVRVKQGGQIFYPWKLDPANPNNAATTGDNIVDNVEQIVIKNPVAGATYEIEINHKNQLRKNKLATLAGETIVELENATEQDYSLIITGINENIATDLAIKNIKIQVSEAEYSTATPVKFEVENKGNAPISGGKLKWKLINKDNNTEEFSGEVKLTNIPAGQSISEIININLSKSFVNYQIVGVVEVGGDQIDINNKKDISAYGYLVDLTQRGTSHFFGFEDDFNKNGWFSEDIDADGRTWRRYPVASFARTGTNSAVNFPNNRKATHDWLFSNPMKMKGGERYRITFSTLKPKDNQEKIDVFFGNAANNGAMTAAIKENVEATREYIRHTYHFTPSADGVHYIGFRNQMPNDVESYAVFIDDITIDFSDKPIVDFKSNTKTANTFTPIEFIDDTFLENPSDPNLAYEWTFTPNTITYAEGSAMAKNPKVIFNNEGLYTVSLKVKDSNHEESITKQDYVNIKNTPVRSRFYTTRFQLYEGQKIGTTNTSSGDPKPTEYEWSISPDTGVEFVGGTNKNSLHPILQFRNAGKYTLGLKATSLAGNEYWERTDYVEVLSARNPVKNLKVASVDSDSHEVKLEWNRPNLAPNYYEDFEGETDKDSHKNLDPEIKIINGNNNPSTWRLDLASRGNGHRSVAIYSFGTDTNDYLILPKQQKGAEIIEYFVQNNQPEHYKVYIVEAPASGNAPTASEIEAGALVYTSDDATHPIFTAKKHDIKRYTANDFYIAIHHKSKNKNGFSLAIDEISIGYENDENRIVNVVRKNDDKVVEDTKVNDNEVITTDEFITTAKLPAPDIHETGVLVDTPKLAGYEIIRNGEVVGNISQNFEVKLAHTDIVRQNGKYTYIINAVYSDGTKKPAEVSVDINNLDDTRLKVYPNPSNGQFTVAAKPSVKSIKAEVYDMAGRLIFQQYYNDYKANIDLSGRVSQGVYILKITDNRNREISKKLFIQ